MDSNPRSPVCGELGAAGGCDDPGRRRAAAPGRGAGARAPASKARTAAPQKRGPHVAVAICDRPRGDRAGKLPDTAPVVTSKANPHYQKHFDRLFALAKAGDWDAVRDYEVKGSNSYSKMVARYRQDLLAVHAASETAQ
jgi:hypothetical protein